ncbi:MAG: hypothetical protein JXB49_35940 [Bacteroidales bacterium]|nr:hypothetical protein [Bacteroidales bacterium]
MKKIIIIAVAFTGLTFFFSSCEKEECKVCAEVTYENGVETSRAKEAEYCDSELDDIESKEPVTVGDMTTKWVCN